MKKQNIGLKIAGLKERAANEWKSIKYPEKNSLFANDDDSVEHIFLSLLLGNGSLVICNILAVRKEEAILGGHSEKAIAVIKFDLSFLWVI